MSGKPEPRVYHLSCVVDAYRSGWTLGEFLAHRFRYHRPEIWDERVREGAVRVNGAPAAGGARVVSGDRIDYAFAHAEPDVDFRYRVLYEDDDVLAVSKSSNLPVHAGGKFIRNTLIARLRAEWGEELRLAHRLDRETSGVVLLAKTRDAARGLEVEFRERRAVKVYFAILRGAIPPEVRVQGAIARRESAGAPYFRVVAPDRGRPAATLFLLRAAGSLAGDPSGPLSLVKAIPEGGRTNQIRVHAAHAGYPILGDKIYGIPEELAVEFVRGGETERILAAAGAPRHLLHCASLRIRHPRSGRWLRVRARLPADFRLALRGGEPRPASSVTAGPSRSS
jgi:RluA family pseudouridine synthase